MSWRLIVSAGIDWGISKVGWRFSSEMQYHYVDPGYFIIDEDYIPDNVSVFLTVQLESGYSHGIWNISRDGGQQVVQEAIAIQVHKENASLVEILVVGIESPQTYAVSARKSTSSGDGIASVSVSKSEAVAGENVRFMATLNPDYVFICWAKVDRAPTESDIVSTDADFWYQINEDTILYAYANRPPSGVNLYVIKNRAWKPTSLEVIHTKNSVKRWCAARLSCKDEGEWK